MSSDVLWVIGALLFVVSMPVAVANISIRQGFSPALWMVGLGLVLMVMAGGLNPTGYNLVNVPEQVWIALTRPLH